jgi:translocation and assembly module TamA
MAIPVALAPGWDRPAWLRRGLRTLSVGLAILATGCGGNGLPFLGEDESMAGPRVPYTVLFEGIDQVDDPGLSAFLTGTSNAAQSTDRPPPSLLILRNRARDDVPRLVTALQARGFYDGSVGFRIDQDPVEERPSAAEGMLDTILGTPATRIVFEIEPGERYQFDRRTVRIEGEPHGYEPMTPIELGLERGDPAIAEVVLAAEERLLRHARTRGHAQAALGERRTIIDRDTRRMDVELSIRPGPRFTFAEPVVTGQTEIDGAFLRQRLLLEPGQRYDVRDVDRARRRLIDTNLFSTVRVFEGPEPDEDGNWPVTFEVAERLHRTIGAGVGYRTDDGPILTAFWEHRNILGAGERLRFEAEVGQLLQRVEGVIRKPDIIIPDLDLVGGGALRREETDAFDSLSIRGNLGVERRFSRRLTGTVGVAYRLSEVEDSDGEETFGLFSVPVGFRFDDSDDLLDPTTGFRISGETAPTWDTLNPGTTFVKNRLVGTRYFRLRNSPRLVLAFRGAAGAIIGTEIENIPADERFYAGGGGSIRGIPFQSAGPLDDSDDPTGGRSLLEGSAEVRYAVLQNVEGVVFLDGGSAFEESIPQFGDAWQFGTGAGIRYLTPVGPIRFDVGVPVDRRDEIDDAWQLYISIGQAF